MRPLGIIILLLWLLGFPGVLFALWFNEIGRAATWEWEACLIPWGLTITFFVLFGVPGGDDDDDDSGRTHD